MSSKDKEKAKLEYQQNLQRQKEVEIEILDAIRRGDIKKIESFPFNADGIDTHLSQSVETNVFPSISKVRLIEKVHGPTVVIYSILCEQPDILMFFLTKFNPDLTSNIDGWTPLHFACATKDTSCLKILLSIRFIQQNINIPILSDVDQNTRDITTPLYIAASYGLHETVLMLTQSTFHVTIPSPIKISFKNTIKTSIRAATGLTPLHVAVRNGDWDMCQILLNCADCDTTITDNKERSPYDLAKELKLNKIVSNFESGEIETREILEGRYIDTFTKEEKNYLKQITDKINDMKKRLDKIESRQHQYGLCSLCEVNIGKLCPDCNQIICKTCWNDPIHRCNTEYD
ncbi:hypothetical protein M9Y10_009556 [Tritrichomonas musculus]|uniref:Ankyrin repeat protein n=1 Tax=Tritrichomonas musculus TaxID=1915356 RepID=A0ABR2IR33_9EUKA